MKKKEIGCFTIGGSVAGPSIPPGWMQRVLGKEIAIDVLSQRLYVPTANGTEVAMRGDTIVYYDDNTYAVKKGGVK